MTLKECREKRGISQTELAKRVGLKQTTISQYEKGSRKPKLSMAKKIASVLGISLDEFVCLSTTIDAEAKSITKTHKQGNSVSSNENVQLSLFENNSDETNKEEIIWKNKSVDGGGNHMADYVAFGNYR